MTDKGVEMKISRLMTMAGLGLMLAALALGCGGDSAGVSSGSSGNGNRAAHRGLSGRVRGGQNPISGSKVLFYGGGTGGSYGSGATVLATATTDSHGDFRIVTFTCPSGNPPTYLVALGGNPGLNPPVNNSAIALVAGLGPCDSLSDSTFVVVNELTTVATEWPLAQFTDSSGQNIGAPLTNTLGQWNAFFSYYNLAQVNPVNFGVSGAPSLFLPSVSACAGGSPPVNCDGLMRLNTLADILASCVNSSGPSSTPCTTLLGNTSSSNTASAAHYIATVPFVARSALFSLVTPNAPFLPILGSLPDGWEIALNHNPFGAAFSNPYALGFDSFGNVFVSDYSSNSVSELEIERYYRIGADYKNSTAKFDAPIAIAVDVSGNVFAANCGMQCSGGISIYGSVSELTAASSFGTGLNFNNTNTGTPGAEFYSPFSLALDPSDDVFAANYNGQSVSELVASAFTTGHNFSSSGAGFADPIGIALDVSANVFVADYFDGVSELTEASSFGTGHNFHAAAAKFNAPTSLQIDGFGNVFAANCGFYCSGSTGNGSVSELTGPPSYGTGHNFAPSGAMLDAPYILAQDGAGNLFTANVSGNSLSELMAPNYASVGSNFAPSGAGFNASLGVALDQSGNVWVGNCGSACGGTGSGSVSELIGLATPVVTPIQGCVAKELADSTQYCKP